MGAVFAIPAAFFTFGLSVPVGIAVGASAGGVVGGSAGVVAGGVAGYKAHREKETIGRTISGAFAKAKDVPFCAVPFCCKKETIPYIRPVPFQENIVPKRFVPFQ